MGIGRGVADARADAGLDVTVYSRAAGAGRDAPAGVRAAALHRQRRMGKTHR